MIKRAVLFPFIFVLYVVLSPLIINLGQIDPAQALRPLGVLLLGTALGILFLYVIFRDGHYAGYLIFLVLVFFFFFAHLSRILQEKLPSNQEQARQILLVGWGLLLAFLALRPIWRRFGGRRLVTPALNFWIGAALLIQVVTGIPKILAYFYTPVQKVQASVLPLTGASPRVICGSNPDIYYLILDAHGRADILQSMYGVDSSQFINFLKQSGFYVADQSHSNYIQTIYSIGSSLNFSFIGPEPPGVSGQKYFTQLIDENRLMGLLKQCGYQTIAFESGFSFSNQPDVDTYLAEDTGLNEFENLLLVGTMVEDLAKKWDWQPPALSYEGHRQRVLYDFDELQKIPNWRGPKFVFAHIVAPHPPFVFDENGNPVQPGRGYSLNDGNDFGGSVAEYRDGYAQQVQFVDQILEKTITAILKNSAKPPVIIIQGDHGPGSLLNWNSPSQTCLLERTSILNAYYLPGVSGEQLYPSITPVNSFRVVLNAYFGTHLDMEQDKTYFTSQTLPRQVIDITPDASSTKNCSP
jgi:hypothetical protein